jgi:hypothetical protein
VASAYWRLMTPIGYRELKKPVINPLRAALPSILVNIYINVTPHLLRWIVNQDLVKGFLPKQEYTSTHI